MSELKNWQLEINDKSLEDSLVFLSEKFKNIVFASSLGVEDQVITHVIAKLKLNIEIITLDTGRLFPETYSLWQRTEEKYGIKITPYYPNADRLQDLIKINGINLFYDSVDLRKKCCEVRKILPLKQALTAKDAWVTGLRKSQSLNRNLTEKLEWDQSFNLYKLNPLCDWSEKEVWDYVKSNNIPYNKLHDQNFPSIGCACCTRAIQPGQDPREGRWWWENTDKKECGLHIKDEK